MAHICNPHIGKIDFSSQGNMLSAHFIAMANPCSIYLEREENTNGSLAINGSLSKNNIINNRLITDKAFARLARSIAEEAWRIEQKYSRYLENSVISIINDSQGHPVDIDPETFNLLTLSDTLSKESRGKFDITSGVLRTLWTFDNQCDIPTEPSIQNVLKHIGWDKVIYNQKRIILPKGMQIDFGGIGKEYATDRCADIGAQLTSSRLLVNLGGDIAVRGEQEKQQPWKVSIESKNGKGNIWKNINLTNGAIATSGDVYKSFVLDGRRYGHIIDATTGYPIENPPRTVTVAAPNCTEAGILTTLAILHGDKAESFLSQTERPFWIQN